MSASLAAVMSALWLGILTSISPCPLATNIAAISYLGNRVEDPKSVLARGFLYTFGRTATYVVLATLSVFAVFSIPRLSFFLQHNMNKVMGPLLLLAGLAVLEVLPVPSVDLLFRRSGNPQAHATTGAWFLGVLFALSFCPTSAALFFGSLIPLAIASHSVVALPAAYGIGTAIPVAGFAILIALGAKSVANAFERLSAIERRARLLTGAIFILLGCYLCAIYLLRPLVS